MGIDRYDLYVDEYEHEPDLHYHECGDWVRFEDHEQVVAGLTKAHQDNLDSWLHQREEIAFLRAELAAKSKDAARYRYIRDCTSADAVDLVTDWSDLELDVAIDSKIGEGNGR